MQTHFIDEQGNYLGSFDGADPPPGSIAVSSMPPDPACLWQFPGWAPSAGMRERRKARVDRLAEEARLQFITPGYGQALVYERKRAEAVDCLAAHDAQNPPPPGKYPMLEAEVPVTAATVLEVANVVKGIADQWTAIAAQIERTRLSAKKAIDEAPTIAQINAVMAGLSWPTP